jgi:hypothetical protein
MLQALVKRGLVSDESNTEACRDLGRMFGPTFPRNANAMLAIAPASSRGQALVLVMIALVVLMGFVALATDIGLMWGARRKMQTAADAAAIAAAIASHQNQDVTSAADNVASLNGFTNGTNSVTITITNPYSDSTCVASANCVKVAITQPQPTYFLRLLGYSSMSVSASAVGGSINGVNCMYALAPSANNALSVSGGSSVTLGCGVLVDSSSTQALVANGGSTLTASSIGVVGNYTGSGYTPTPATGIVPAANPLSYLQSPAVGACNSLTAAGHGYTATNGATISQGTYCNGITVQGGATLNLNSGLYILNGNGLTVGGGSTIIGNGVTFFNTGAPTTTCSYGPITIAGTSSTSLIAPTSGTWAGSSSRTPTSLRRSRTRSPAPAALSTRAHSISQPPRWFIRVAAARLPTR